MMCGGTARAAHLFRSLERCSPFSIHIQFLVRRHCLCVTTPRPSDVLATKVVDKSHEKNWRATFGSHYVLFDGKQLVGLNSILCASCLGVVRLNDVRVRYGHCL